MLDTNIPSELSKPQPDKRVDGWLRSQSKTTLFISAITVGELRRGALLLDAGTKRGRLEHWIETSLDEWFAGRILSVDEAVARQWSELDVARRRAGKPLDITDGLIAATALVNGLMLVTRNSRDFEDLGIRLVNPWLGV